jgi:hypothetical protein
MNALKTSAIALALLAAPAGAAFADDDFRCSVGNTGWISIAEVAEKAKAAGYTPYEVERDDGCYEIKGTALDGRWVKVKLHPSTGEVVQVRDRRGYDD